MNLPQKDELAALRKKKNIHRGIRGGLAILGILSLTWMVFFLSGVKDEEQEGRLSVQEELHNGLIDDYERYVEEGVLWDAYGRKDQEIMIEDGIQKLEFLLKDSPQTEDVKTRIKSLEILKKQYQQTKEKFKDEGR